MTPDEYTRQAVRAVREAVNQEHSFPEWLASVLVIAVCDRPAGTFALIAGRADSWEAGLVEQLVAGTVGRGDEHLADYRAMPGGPDDPAAAQPVPVAAEQHDIQENPR